ncbi:hypothetical protein FHS68_001530 [Dyadobacter arcticus]|uniref:Uncharacterized protein n=1 Tax=Dyadobacter arcticus TaxID=1078754 RepID=A0ABX0UK23_9BACT|nr:hypothetical protein [Dyadobacter arcticus]
MEVDISSFDHNLAQFLLQNEIEKCILLVQNQEHRINRF